MQGTQALLPHGDAFSQAGVSAEITGILSIMSVESQKARQLWLLLSPSLLAVMVLLFVPLQFIVVYS